MIVISGMNNIANALNHISFGQMDKLCTCTCFVCLFDCFYLFFQSFIQLLYVR